MVDQPDNVSKIPFYKAELTLGNLLLLIGMMGAVGAGVWQGGAIRASLEEGLKAEHNLREVEMTSIHTDIASLGRDIRELRTYFIAERVGMPSKGRP